MIDDFLVDGLRMWKDEGVPAPLNELQSISAWLAVLGEFGEEETKDRMRMRMVLLMNAAEDLHAEGVEAVKTAGIYANRPELDPNSELVLEERARCLNIVESYKVPVGNSAAGEMAAEWTMDALREVRNMIQDPNYEEDV